MMLIAGGIDFDRLQPRILCQTMERMISRAPRSTHGSPGNADAAALCSAHHRTAPESDILVACCIGGAAFDLATRTSVPRSAWIGAGRSM